MVIGHLDDTIAAIITPPGCGGVGMIRISGKNAVDIASRIIKNFPKDVKPRYVYHGWVFHEGKLIDEVLYYYMKAPNSYTGEDVVEISAHGGYVLLKHLLDLAIKFGARVAQRGEFTKRAFLNGRIDLAQAEAVVDLISAKSLEGIGSFARLLGGELSSKINFLRSRLVEFLAEIEARIDFPDDVGDLDFKSSHEIVRGFVGDVDNLLAKAKYGKVMREGVRVAIIGKPNVGKSSLLNALLGEERAIVTNEPGTTRDAIEEIINVNGLPLLVVDTAGIRHPKSKPEEFGVEKTKKEIELAELILLVLDASSRLTEEDMMVLNATSGKTRIVVLNKIDLGIEISLNGKVSVDERVEVSALRRFGIDALKEQIYHCVLGGKSNSIEDCALINSRHKECLERAKEALVQTEQAILERQSEEFIAFNLKQAIISLGEICGENVSEEVINEIFSRFCVGK